MKIDRQVGIIAILRQKGKVTAPYLAEMFEVSRRTINRDIEDICRAGIPIVAEQGAGGGFSLEADYALDAKNLTPQEWQVIFTGLKTLDSFSKHSVAKQLAERIGGMPADEDLHIDLTSFYKDSHSEKIAMLKAAIAEHKQVAFRYYYHKGDTDKRIEPYSIVFMWGDWYLYGYCMQRSDFRLYKLRRLWELELCLDTFEPRKLPPMEQRFGTHIHDDYIITAEFAPEVKYKLVEEYGPDCFVTLPSGRLQTQWGHTDPNDALAYYLGFGTKVRIVSPEDFRKRLIAEAQQLLEQY